MITLSFQTESAYFEGYNIIQFYNVTVLQICLARVRQFRVCYCWL
jgi:hypothetical protein